MVHFAHSLSDFKFRRSESMAACNEIRLEGQSLLDLHCHEDFVGELNVAEEDDTYIDVTPSCVGDSNYTEDEYVSLLANEETSRGFGSNQSLIIDNWLKDLRLEAITWILGTRKIFGFHFHTVYLSMIYFDKIVSSRCIDRKYTWLVKLISFACLCLAAKMEEGQVPPFSQFQTDEIRFESSVMKRVELGILTTLKWRMNYTTPFAFLRYFIIKFSRKDSPPREIVSKTVRSILALMKDIHLMAHRPSVVAAAATLMVLNNSLTKTTLANEMNSIAYPGFLEIEDVFRCYNVLQKLEVENFHTPNAINSSSRNFLVTLPDGSKKRRLTFNDPDQQQQG